MSIILWCSVPYRYSHTQDADVRSAIPLRVSTNSCQLGILRGKTTKEGLQLSRNGAMDNDGDAEVHTPPRSSGALVRCYANATMGATALYASGAHTALPDGSFGNSDDDRVKDPETFEEGEEQQDLLEEFHNELQKVTSPCSHCLRLASAGERRL